MGSTSTDSPKKILIVDDEPAIVETLSEVLKEGGRETIGFTNPGEALEWGKKSSFDLLITDIKMYPMSGLDLHEKLAFYYPDLITIVITAYSSLDTAEKAIASHVYAYIHKPFRLNEIRQLVAQALEKKELLDRNRELVDEQQRLIEKLLAANKELKKLDQIKSDFVSTVSHELRTPLTSMRNILYNLLNVFSEGFGTKQIEYLKMMEEDAKRLEGLIGDILDLSKLESGAYQLKLSQFQIKEVIESALRAVEHIRASKSSEIILELDARADSLSIEADKNKIEQVLINLVTNAIKYSDIGKKIRIHTTVRAEKCEIEVRDEGFGLTAEDMERVFKRFERGSQGIRKGVKGTGLGLAIVKRIADMHGGSIRVESELSRGSTFTFELPIKGVR